MFELIGNIFKYSLGVIVVLVLSHIIEIKSVSISDHVLHGMHWVSGYSPKTEMQHFTDSVAEVSHADQAALNRVIEKSQFKKK